MSNNEPMSGEQIIDSVIDNLTRVVEAAEAGLVSVETAREVADLTESTIAAVAFGGCDFVEKICKFYSDASICDRSCNDSFGDL